MEVRDRETGGAERDEARVREREEGKEGERMRMMLNPYLNFLKQS